MATLRTNGTNPRALNHNPRASTATEDVAAGHSLCSMTMALPGFEPPAPPAPVVTANTITARLVEMFGAHCTPLSSRYRGQVAKQAKELLDDGFAPVVVLSAAVQACRRSEPHQMTRIAQDIVNARSGLLLTRRQAETKMQDLVELGALDGELDQVNAWL